jgi:hypothetical protein
MSTSQNVMNSVVFVTTLIKNQRLNVNGQEPAVTMSNIVLQRVLGPPFRWRQNRSSFSFAINTAGGTDYSVSVPSLGWIEDQWLVDGQGKIHELKGSVSMAKGGESRRPTKVAPQYDDNQGNITFRFDSIPAANYTAYFDYQKKAQLIQSWADPWGVIPDECGYIYNTGLLALAALLVNDARFQIWNREFVASLLATQDGLDEQAKAIFLAGWLNDMRSAQRSQSASQLGTQGRGQ